ncbi:DUF977 family protein [Escherichia coli]|nr:DUF977 family protein [Escherichia coli]
MGKASSQEVAARLGMTRDEAINELWKLKRRGEADNKGPMWWLSVLARELVASGDVYNSGYGLFPSAQARKDWQNARKKLSRANLKKTSVVDPDLIWSLPDGEIRRYDRRQNIICSECRKSAAMQRVLAFYQGKFQEAIL